MSLIKDHRKWMRTCQYIYWAALIRSHLGHSEHFDSILELAVMGAAWRRLPIAVRVDFASMYSMGGEL